MTVVERAAEVITEAFLMATGRLPSPDLAGIAQALADAGLLRQTPEELLTGLGPDECQWAQQLFNLDRAREAVIKAAKAWREGCAAIEYTYPTEDDLATTVDALLKAEAQP